MQKMVIATYVFEFIFKKKKMSFEIQKFIKI